jgi:hypothetical protein
MTTMGAFENVYLPTLCFTTKDTDTINEIRRGSASSCGSTPGSRGGSKLTLALSMPSVAEGSEATESNPLDEVGRDFKPLSDWLSAFSEAMPTHFYVLSSMPVSKIPPNSGCVLYVDCTRTQARKHNVAMLAEKSITRVIHPVTDLAIKSSDGVQSFLSKWVPQSAETVL